MGTAPRFHVQIPFVLVLLAFSCAIPAQAMSVEPLVLDVAAVGNTSSGSFKVGNEGATAFPVEIDISRMEIGSRGELRYEKADRDFIIYPPQANIPKGGAQVFRVQWIGDPMIKSSRNYRLSVAQVPVKLPKEVSGIQVSMSFSVIVSVSPAQESAALAVTSATLSDVNGKRAATLQIKNNGLRHAYLRNAVISLAGGGWSTKLSPHEVEQKIGLGIIQPGKERRFLLPVEVPGNVSDITASIDYQPEK